MSSPSRALRLPGAFSPAGFGGFAALIGTVTLPSLGFSTLFGIAEAAGLNAICRFKPPTLEFSHHHIQSKPQDPSEIGRRLARGV